MRSGLRGGYWKIWHNSKLRLAGALVVVAWLMWSAYGPLNHRPHPCMTATEGALLTQLESSWRVIAVTRPPAQRAEIAYGMKDARILAVHCEAGKVPNVRYAVSVGNWTYTITRGVWDVALPYLLLFVGILLSVGPPFTGESNESFTLTFSLPWAREQWLWTKVGFSIAILLGITLLVFAVGQLGTRFPYMDEMLTPARWYGDGKSHYVYGPTLMEFVRAMVAGLVGISLGMWASMLTRNALAAGIGAGIVAFALVALDLGDILPSRLYSGAVLLTLDNTGGMIAGITIICGSALLAMIRLQDTDF
jgi:hypothetical protein